MIENSFDAILWTGFVCVGLGYLFGYKVGSPTTDQESEPCEHTQECADSQAAQAFRYAGLAKGDTVGTVNAVLFAIKHTDKKTFDYGTNHQLTLDTDNCVCTIKSK